MNTDSRGALMLAAFVMALVVACGCGSSPKAHVDTAASCGPLAVDCTRQPGVSQARCEDGACVATMCMSGYWLSIGRCLAEDPHACGEPAVDCTALPHVDSVVCNKGTCQATSCAPSFALKDGACGPCDGDPVCAPGEVTASVDSLASVIVAWQLPTGSVQPVKFLVERDGAQIGEVEGNARRFEDTGAAPGSVALLGTLTLSASQATVEGGVALSWNSLGVSRSPGPMANYIVIAVYADENRAASRGAQGCIASPSSSVVYEIKRDEGDWSRVGSGTAYLDAEAPKGTLGGTVTAVPDISRGLVVLTLDSSNLSVTPAPEATYRVRAILGSVDPIVSEPVKGRRLSSTDALEIAWERSVDATGAIFETLAGVTGRVWFDPVPVVDQDRQYRAVVSNQGALGSTAAASARLLSVKQVALGDSHACAIRSDDRVTCWGFDDGRAPALVPGGAFKSISGGDDFTCGLRANDTITCWGPAYSYPVNSVPVGTMKDVASGSRHAIALNASGKIIGWGYNANGQAPETPTAASYKALYAGTDASCGMRADGTVACWGRDEENWVAGTPTTVAFKMIAPGRGFACGIKLDGKLVCWGEAKGANVPEALVDATFKHVACGDYHACAVRADDTVVCWGSNISAIAPLPQPLGAFRFLAAHNRATCGVRVDGRVHCWGLGANGQAPPTPPVDDFESISAGSLARIIHAARRHENFEAASAGA